MLELRVSGVRGLQSESEKDLESKDSLMGVLRTLPIPKASSAMPSGTTNCITSDGSTCDDR